MTTFEKFPDKKDPGERRFFRKLGRQVFKGKPEAVDSPAEEIEELDNLSFSSVGLEELIRALQVRNGLNTHESDYDVFYTPESREELYDIGKGISEYVRSNDIGTICFLDRSARPAYLAMTTFWNKEHPDVKKPDIRFLNPKGFVSSDDAMDGRVDILKMTIDDLYKQGAVESADHMRSTTEIIDDLTDNFNSSDKKDKPILLFDACIHTGSTLLPVVDKFFQAGIYDLRIGTVSDNGTRTDLPLDLKIMNGEPDRICYPFGKDRMVTKVYGSITSEKNVDTYDREMAVKIRKEIKRAVEEQWDQEHGK